MTIRSFSLWPVSPYWSVALFVVSAGAAAYCFWQSGCCAV